jgi:hypothetical protein
MGKRMFVLFFLFWKKQNRRCVLAPAALADVCIPVLVYLQQNKKARAEGKKCHAKTTVAISKRAHISFFFSLCLEDETRRRYVERYYSSGL